jgi:alginate O-acetyltransferase complex protein AlgI
VSQLYSLEYFGLLAVVAGALVLLPRQRELLVLLASVLFAICASNEYVVGGLAVASLIVYAAGRWLQRCPEGAGRLLLLILALLGIWSLAIFSARYDWLMNLGSRLGHDPGERLLRSGIVAWASRAGVSFLALRMTSYLVDSLFRQQHLSLRHYLIYLFYFPAFLAGPVDRPWAFGEKLSDWSGPAWRDVVAGADRLLTGLLKKFVLADILLPYTLAEVTVGEASWTTVALSTFAYSLYIYWEFSGYSDIVLGASRLIGIRLPENFNRPYWQTDLSAFWRCWHMSFSNWLRDYLFQPMNLFLSRSLSPLSAALPALLTTMALCGLWHGYTLGYLVWGLHHGIGLGVHRFYQSWVPRRLGRRRYREVSAGRSYRIAGWAITFLWVSLGWIWFALPLPDAWWAWRRLLGLVGGDA